MVSHHKSMSRTLKKTSKTMERFCFVIPGACYVFVSYDTTIRVVVVVCIVVVVIIINKNVNWLLKLEV